MTGHPSVFLSGAQSVLKAQPPSFWKFRDTACGILQKGLIPHRAALLVWTQTILGKGAPSFIVLLFLYTKHFSQLFFLPPNGRIKVETKIRLFCWFYILNTVAALDLIFVYLVNRKSIYMGHFCSEHINATFCHTNQWPIHPQPGLDCYPCYCIIWFCSVGKDFC